MQKILPDADTTRKEIKSTITMKIGISNAYNLIFGGLKEKTNNDKKSLNRRIILIILIRYDGGRLISFFIKKLRLKMNSYFLSGIH